MSPVLGTILLLGLICPQVVVVMSFLDDLEPMNGCAHSKDDLFSIQKGEPFCPGENIDPWAYCNEHPFSEPSCSGNVPEVNAEFEWCYWLLSQTVSGVKLEWVPTLKCVTIPQVTSIL